ncbi:MAG: hypothetical protein JRH20_05530 [Deltaproteobacteria bacterium]|nr:hypothetical protein [Deltaproteobacteria bacterium]
MLRAWALILTLLAGGCASAPTLGLPYPFSQGLLNPDSALPSRLEPRQRRPRALRRDSAVRKARRCRSRIGQRVEGTRSQAQRLLLSCTLGAKAARRLKINALTPSSKRPQLGDIVIFDDARDANGNGKLDDPRSDVGVVVSLRGQLVRFVYVSGTRFRRGVLHLRRRAQRRFRGKTINSYVRVKTPSDPPRSRYLAGELLHGFARVASK